MTDFYCIFGKLKFRLLFLLQTGSKHKKHLIQQLIEAFKVMVMEQVGEI